MHEVRCTGCLVLLGYSLAPADYRIYCSEECANDYPVRVNEQRDDLIAALFFEPTRDAQLHTLFGMTRQGLHQIATRRDPRREQ